jgi:hypothetical protein
MSFFPVGQKRLTNIAVVRMKAKGKKYTVDLALIREDSVALTC